MFCKNCQKEFTIIDADKKFYASIDVPEPLNCPACRRQQLLCWRNERTLYGRKCDKTGKDIISVFNPEKKYIVYDRDYWWSDEWEPTDYGQDFDFTKTFNEQYDQLLHKVPMVAIFNNKTINSQYCNHVGEMKNCYLVFASWDVEDSLYSDMLHNSHDSVDILESKKLEKCYELINCFDCYNVHYSINSENCLDSFFLYDCRACNSCIGCTNLRNKKYHIFNQAYTKDEYEKKLAELQLNTRSGIEKARERFLKLKEEAIHRYAFLINCYNCTGDSLIGAKDCHDCYALDGIESCAYCINGVKQLKDTYDGYGIGINSERGYFILDSGINDMDTFFCAVVWSCQYAYYCYNCHGCQEIFGCTGLRNKKYCILNKQYSKEEYFEIKEKIIDYMRKTGEWGEFFDPKISPFGINETIARAYSQIPKEEVLARGFNWQDNLPGTFGRETRKDLPETIGEVSENITKEIFACRECKKNYKIIGQELKFYQEMNIPISDKCPDCRYLYRLSIRNPRELWHRQCMCESSEHGHEGRCKNEFETVYSPDRPEKIYCEDCYKKEIY